MQARQNYSIHALNPAVCRAGTVTLSFFLMLVLVVRADAAGRVVVWDTGVPLVDEAALESRAGWKAVPSELFLFESDPAKAAADPGYYGREYVFKGDTVVENQNLQAIFDTTRGRVSLLARGSSATARRKIADLAPLGLKPGDGATIRRCAIIRNAGDEVTIEASFDAKSGAGGSSRFSFDRSDLVEMKPSEQLKGLRVVAPLDYGVVPSFVADDLIYDPAAYPATDSLAVPAENVFVGLASGGDRMLVLAWPKGRQQVRLSVPPAPVGRPRRIESFDFTADGQSLFLAALSGPGLWHRTELKPAFLEKDVPLEWKRPFPAKWKTQLSEAGVATTFAFREAKAQIWRGVPGSYNYPAWIEGDSAFLHLSKKVPPKGEALVYFLEAQDTPPGIATPVDFLKAALGRAESERILDPAGRQLRTHHRRGGDGVHRACTCGFTEAIQAIFEAREETGKKTFIESALDDMIFFVNCHVDRIDEYQRFAADLQKFLSTKAAGGSEVKAYIDAIEPIVQQIPQEYTVQKENMKSLDYARDLLRQTMALAGKTDPDNLKAYMELLKSWRAMGGAQDYVVAQCHALTRKLFQEAGYASATRPDALGLAEEIRARCRQVLRNPDGYEIWADY